MSDIAAADFGVVPRSPDSIGPPDRIVQPSPRTRSFPPCGQFLADAAWQKLDVEPRDGAYLADVIPNVYATPKEIVERVSALTK